MRPAPRAPQHQERGLWGCYRPARPQDGLGAREPLPGPAATRGTSPLGAPAAPCPGSGGLPHLKGHGQPLPSTRGQAGAPSPGPCEPPPLPKPQSEEATWSPRSERPPAQPTAVPALGPGGFGEQPRGQGGSEAVPGRPAQPPEVPLGAQTTQSSCVCIRGCWGHSKGRAVPGHLGHCHQQGHGSRPCRSDRRKDRTTFLPVSVPRSLTLQWERRPPPSRAAWPR